MYRTANTDAIFTSDTFSNIYVFDLRRGTTLMQYKSGAIGTHCLNVLNNDYIVAAEKGPLINIWPINNQEKLQNIRMLCPGMVGCSVVSPNGFYVAVSVGEKLLIWQLSSGKLLSTCCNHYQPITVIKWSQDSADIATGGEDGLVCIWKLSHLICSNYMYLGTRSNDTTVTQTTPRFTFSHHSIKITDLYISYGGLRSRLFTVSADKTCKIYDLSSGTQLVSVIFDVRPTCITVDTPEIYVFVGTFDGLIKIFSIRDAPRSLEHYFNESDSSLRFSGHIKPVTCLALSIDETILVSGSADETIRLWHVTSKQCIKTIRMKGSISNIIVKTIPESLHADELYPTTVVKSFQKRYDDNTDSLNLDIICPVDNFRKRTQEELGNSGNVSALTQQIEELKRINRELFNFAKDKILEKNDSVKSTVDHTAKQISAIIPKNNISGKKKKRLIKKNKK